MVGRGIAKGGAHINPSKLSTTAKKEADGGDQDVIVPNDHQLTALGLKSKDATPTLLEVNSAQIVSHIVGKEVLLI